MPLPPKHELYKELRRIATSIIKEIVEPITGNENLQTDLWLSDIELWTLGDEDANFDILVQIKDKYELTETQMVYIDSFTPIIQIALYIYLSGSSFDGKILLDTKV